MCRVESIRRNQVRIKLKINDEGHRRKEIEDGGSGGGSAGEGDQNALSTGGIVYDPMEDGTGNAGERD